MGSLFFLPAGCAALCLALFAAVLSQSAPDILGTAPPFEGVILRQNPAFKQEIQRASGTTPRWAGEAVPAPLLRVCVGWVALYFAFLFFQSASKFRAHDLLKAAAKAKDEKAPGFAAVKYGSAGNKFGALIGDRTAGNMLEQSIPFLTGLALHAVLVSVNSAAQLGWLWLLSRLIYPACFSQGIPLLFVSTLPGYLCIAMLWQPIVTLALK
eukprot:SAG22_NODE_4968_length_1120_cov_1.215475_1_plen_211_part_00